MTRACLTDALLSLIETVADAWEQGLVRIGALMQQGHIPPAELGRWARCTRALIVLTEDAERQRLPWRDRVAPSVAACLARSEARVAALGLPMPAMGEPEVTFH